MSLKLLFIFVFLILAFDLTHCRIDLSTFGKVRIAKNISLIRRPLSVDLNGYCYGNSIQILGCKIEHHAILIQFDDGRTKIYEKSSAVGGSVVYLTEFVKVKKLAVIGDLFLLEINSAIQSTSTNWQWIAKKKNSSYKTEGEIDQIVKKCLTNYKVLDDNCQHFAKCVFEKLI